jgi:hypothetical protein
MRARCPIARTVLLVFAALATADVDTRTVQSEFDRCESVMERVKREMLRFEDAVGRLKRALDGRRNAVDREVMQSYVKLENRVDYLRGRIDRSAGQRDKINGDLKNVSGPTCPSCVVSSVNLFCRNGETLTREIEECLADAAALQDRLGATGTMPEGWSSGGDTAQASFIAERASIETAIAAYTPRFDTCTSEAAGTLRKQFEANLRRADSLQAAGGVTESLQALKLAGLLLKQASAKCGAK